MTKVQNPIIGRAKGSAGGMTFSKNYDKNVMRAKAFEVSNPNTQAQQTQRGFFAELQEIVASVTEAQLRTLFGYKPKAMSRRNMLSRQVAAANSIDGTTKSVDFTKLEAIGNGVKCNAALYTTDSVQPGAYQLEETNETMGLPEGSTANLVIVVFNHTKKTISVCNTSVTVEENEFAPTSFGVAVGDKISYYPTVSTNGENVVLKGFGSFIIKTRAEKAGRKIQKNNPI